MQLNALSSLEDLMSTVDLLCIPASRDMLGDVHRDILSLIVPRETLPPLEELNIQNHSIAVFYGSYAGRRIRVLLGLAGEMMTESAAFNTAKRLSIRARTENSTLTGLVAHHLGENDLISATFTGWTAGQYDLGIFKKTNGEANVKGVRDIYTYLSSAASQHAQDGITVGMVQHEVMNLVNTPSSHQSPEIISDWARGSAERYGYACTVLDKDQLKHLGMHALLAVNRGSEHPARCIVTHYAHPDASQKVVLVGKGVVFDTGGISIKLSKNMHYMKSDMAGAAAALGVVEACARLGLRADVMAITPVTDNSIDNTSIKPGDVISSYAGKTIEVIDTDAEGRLILADAIAYAVKEFKPDILIDMATLTGNIIASLGPVAAGLFTSDDKLASSLYEAGEVSGERVWRMPMYEEYHDDMQSDIADIKNLSEKPYAGAASAAKFLEYFTEDHPSWAHLDIAGTAFQANGFGKSYCATAYGVRLMVKWITSAIAH